jgi:DNA-binding response OmpR family regulator
MKALIVDDDRTLADLLDFTLRREGFESYLAYNCSSALSLFQEKSVDIIILDVNLPGEPGIKNGFDLCQRIRQKSDVPIILLTVRDEEEDILRGLDLGADDYILKPFSPRQLAARIKTVLRRSKLEHPKKSEPFIYGGVIFDPRRREFTRKGQTPITLTPLESRLLEYLMRNAGQILLTENIITEVWGPEEGSDEMLRQLVRRLRVKIEENPSEPELVTNLQGVGYGFAVE